MGSRSGFCRGGGEGPGKEGLPWQDSTPCLQQVSKLPLDSALKFGGASQAGRAEGMLGDQGPTTNMHQKPINLHLS